MDLVQRARNILLQPKREWPIIKAERTTTQELFSGYVLILAAIGPLASLIGMSMVGIELPFVGRFRKPFLQGLLSSLLAYGLSLVIVFLLSRIINWLAPTFGGVQDTSQAMKVAAYGFTAAWLGGIFSLFPVLSVFGLPAALDSLYLLYTGLPVLMKSAPDRALGYLVSVVLAGVVIIVPTIGMFILKW